MVTGNKITTRAQFIDDAIDSTAADSSALSIFQSEDGLSFSLADVNTGKILLLTDYTLDQRPDAGLELLSQFNERFSKYFAGWQPEVYTWVPKELFNPEDAIEMGKQTLGISNASFTEVEELEAVLLHSPIPNVLERLVESLETVRVLPKPAADAIAVLKQWKRKPGEHVYLHIEKESIDILVLSNGKMLLQNSFKAKTGPDKLYFVLYALEQLKLEADHVPLKITGEILEKDDLWKTLETYVRYVDWLEEIDPIHSSAAIPKAQLKKYAPVVHLHSCG